MIIELILFSFSLRSYKSDHLCLRENKIMINYWRTFIRVSFLLLKFCKIT